MSLSAPVVETSGVRRGLLGLAALAVALTSFVSATDYAVFGPETFRRETGSPVTVRRTFVVRKAVPPGFLRVANDGVSSGEIAINGQVVVGPSDFSRDAGVLPLIQRGITL